MMPILIIYRDRFDEKYQCSGDQFIDVYLADGCINIFSDSYKFGNLIDLLRYLEKNYIFSDIIIYNSILSFSSEINIRSLFAGFLGLAQKSLTYIDSDARFISRAGLLARVFNSIGVFPEYAKVHETSTLFFRRDSSIKTWSDVEKSLVFKVVSEHMLTVSDFIHEISNSISLSEPYSFTRVNHCENRLLGYGFSFPQEEAEITYQIQFGYMLASDDTFDISNMLRRAIANSNTIGVPTIKKLSSDKLQILENTTFAHLRYLNCYLGKNYTSVNIHYELGRSLDFKKLLAQVDVLYAITCRDVKNLEFSLNRSVRIISIPAEYVFSDKVNCTKHYPEVFLKVRDLLRTTIKPGNLVLVGAGILGKIYCDEVKKAGGVAVDLGSFFDAVSGINSRGKGFKNDFWWHESNQIQD